MPERLRYKIYKIIRGVVISNLVAGWARAAYKLAHGYILPLSRVLPQRCPINAFFGNNGLFLLRNLV